MGLLNSMEEKILEFKVRCPSFEETFPIQAPARSSVAELKHMLTDIIPSNPPSDEQRIIYLGKLLVDSEILEDILRPEEDQQPTLHLVLRKEVSSPSKISHAATSPLKTSPTKPVEVPVTPNNDKDDQDHAQNSSTKANTSEVSSSSSWGSKDEAGPASLPNNHTTAIFDVNSNLTLEQLLTHHNPSQEPPMIIINGYVYRMNIPSQEVAQITSSFTTPMATSPVSRNNQHAPFQPAAQINPPEQQPPIPAQQAGLQGLVLRFLWQPLLNMWTYLFGPAQEMDAMEAPPENPLWLFVKYAIVMALLCQNASKKQILYYGMIFLTLFLYEAGYLSYVIPRQIRQLIQPRVFPAPNPAPVAENDAGELQPLLNEDQQQQGQDGSALRHAFDVSTTFFMSLVPSLEPVHAPAQ